MSNCCKAFNMKDENDALNHIRGYAVVKEYGSSANGHALHTWDAGERYLARCSKCGGLILVQESEFHGMEDDSYYTDYFPVASEEEAEQLNLKNDGFEIEREFVGRYLMKTNGWTRWSE